MSPIKGLTDNVRTGFPPLGVLHKGAKKPNDRQPGPELQYWRFASEDRPDLETAFVEIYGEEPIELEVILPFAAIDDNFPVWKEAWGAGSLKHRCDGETCMRWLTERGVYSEEPIKCPGGCKEIGRLNVILPDMVRAGHVGITTAVTHSINDIVSILGTLQAIKDARGIDDMRGILFILRRVNEKISTPGENGKRVRRKKCMVKLIPAQEWVQAQLEYSQRLALPSGDQECSESEEDENVVNGEAREIDDDESSWDEALFTAGEEDKGPAAQPIKTEAAIVPETSSKVPARPMPQSIRRAAGQPKQVKGWLQAKARVLNRDGARLSSNGQRGAMVGALESLFPSETPEMAAQCRYSLQKFIFGPQADTSKNLTDAQVLAFLGWAQTKDELGHYVPDSVATTEANRIVNMLTEEAGQTKMADLDAEYQAQETFEQEQEGLRAEAEAMARAEVGAAF